MVSMIVMMMLVSFMNGSRFLIIICCRMMIITGLLFWGILGMSGVGLVRVRCLFVGGLGYGGSLGGLARLCPQSIIPLL